MTHAQLVLFIITLSLNVVAQVPNHKMGEICFTKDFSCFAPFASNPSQPTSEEAKKFALAPVSGLMEKYMVFLIVKN